jgi:AcrR family transcriptional regulator
MGPRTPRRRDAAATRQRLLIAARSRFAVLGYDRTTTREIAADAEVNVSLIQRYFGSKDGLYAAVLTESAATFASAENGDDEGGESGRQQMVDALVEGLRPDAWPEYGHEHPLMLMLRDTGTDPALDELRRTSMAAWVRSVAHRLDLDRDDGTRAELATAAIAGLVVLHALVGGELAITRDETVLRAELDRLLEMFDADAEGEPHTP